jgi:hypothetical protein
MHTHLRKEDGNWTLKHFLLFYPCFPQKPSRCCALICASMCDRYSLQEANECNIERAKENLDYSFVLLVMAVK